MRSVELGKIKIGDDKNLALIAGPCVIESRQGCMRIAEELVKITGRLGMPFIFKASYDKANRSSVDSFRGPGLEEGIDILRQIRSELGVPVLSDVHTPREVEIASPVLDVLQIPAFLCRQTDLILEAARSGKAVNIKKGQFLSPQEMMNVVKKSESVGCRDILLTERGTSFGYNALVNDFKGLVIMRELGYPVVYDATHSVQCPGARGSCSGGDSRYVEPLSLAAVATGSCDAIFVEVHEDPSKAKSDGPNMLKLSELEKYLEKVNAVFRTRKRI